MGKKSPAPARGWQAHAAPLAFLLAFFCLGVVLYHTLAGGTLLAANPYDSYSLQAQNWLAGSLSIRHGEAYPWLELAVFQGRYYLSFPPVPTLFALPWAGKRLFVRVLQRTGHASGGPAPGGVGMKKSCRSVFRIRKGRLCSGAALRPIGGRRRASGCRWAPGGFFDFIFPPFSALERTGVL